MRALTKGRSQSRRVLVLGRFYEATVSNSPCFLNRHKYDGRIAHRRRRRDAQLAQTERAFATTLSVSSSRT
jgi:hypothetical protein